MSLETTAGNLKELVKSATEWAALNPIIPLNQLIYSYTLVDGQRNYVSKMGDGVTHYNDLPEIRSTRVIFKEW